MGVEVSLPSAGVVSRQRTAATHAGESNLEAKLREIVEHAVSAVRTVVLDRIE